MAASEIGRRGRISRARGVALSSRPPLRAGRIRAGRSIGRMPMHRRGRAALALLLVVAGAAAAEESPAKPVKILVPYPPGGAVDILTRTLGQPLSELWHQPVVI